MGETAIDPEPSTRVADLGTEFWHQADLVDAYDDTRLRPVEAVLFDRYRAALSGRVLEVGVGAGRLTRHLCAMASTLSGLDVSPVMVERALQACPAATIEVRDLRDLSAYGDGTFDAVVAGFNVIDIVDHEDRLSVLADVRRILAPDGLFLFSSHNRAFIRSVHGPVRQVFADLGRRRFRRAAGGIVRLPRRVANHRRLHPYERAEPTYAIVNDTAHDYAVLQYYVTRDEQEHQLAAAGFALLDCRDLGANEVPAGTAAGTSSELHYVARLAATSA
jgi:SAM-dependent methyltransferase